MANMIQVKKGQKSNIPVLSSAELGYAIDTQEVFIGTGSSNIRILTEDDLYTDFDVDAHLYGGVGIDYSPDTSGGIISIDDTIVQTTDLNIIKYPDNVKLDTTNTDVSFSSVFSAISTVAFGPANNGAGSIWLNFNYPTFFDINEDVLIKINYSLNGVDNSKVIEINNKIWTTSVGSSLNSASPDLNYTDTINSSSSNTSVLQNNVFTNAKISASSISDFITIQLTRTNTVNDTYTGTFHLISVVFYQV